MPDRDLPWAMPLAASMLLWPAVWNGYPLVFADTGTYLSQAINGHLGWDRPPFYSLFMLPLHLTITTWPVVAAQAMLTVAVLRMVAAVRWRWMPLVAAALAALTWLPFLVSQLMPDVFTPLLILVLLMAPVREATRFWKGWRPFSLVLPPPSGAGAVSGGPDEPGHDAIKRGTRRAFPRPLNTLWPTEVNVVFTAFTIAAQQSSLLLSLALLPFRPSAIKPIFLAVTALLAVSMLAHHRLALSPYGNVFMLARVIYDGPGMDALHRQCPGAGWRLCAYLDRFPPKSDDFLWRSDSPIVLAGGHKIISAEADAIIAAALRAEPGREALAMLRNGWEQLTRYASGDGLESWPIEVTPWIERDFPPAEQARYAAGLQARGLLAVPPWLARIHTVVAETGIVACAVLLPFMLYRRHRSARWLLGVLFVLPVSALITGGLSTPHDRYQSRIMWLPPFVAACAIASVQKRQT